MEANFEQTALEGMIYAEYMNRIYTALDRLPAQCRKVFILHYIEGKKVTEVAAELGLSIHTVNAHKSRGIGLLQKMLLSLCFYFMNSII